MYTIIFLRTTTSSIYSIYSKDEFNMSINKNTYDNNLQEGEHK